MRKWLEAMPSRQAQEEHIPQDGLLMSLGWYFKNVFADSVLVSGINEHNDRLWDVLDTDLKKASELV